MANDFTKKALYYLIYSGTFYCTDNYKVSRNQFNSYLFMHIKKGRLKINYNDQQFIAQKDSFVFLNCYHPHSYQAETETIFDWFHFDGNSSEYYFNLLYEKNGCHYSLDNNYMIPELMSYILKMAEENNVDEHNVSINIHRIFYELKQASHFSDETTEKKIKQAIRFMENHYKDDIKLEDISSYVYLSPYYFTRIFKKQMNCTPIQYLINYRIHRATNILHTTNLTISEVSDACGFNSTSHFVTTFKKHIGVSPNKFRNIQF